MFPFRPSTESPNGCMCTRLPQYWMLRHWCTLTRSPSFTCKLLRAALFIWIRPSFTSSEVQKMRTVLRSFSHSNHVPSVLISHIGTKRDSPELLTNNICYKNELPLPVKIAVENNTSKR